jgi:hypothetical protein
MNTNNSGKLELRDVAVDELQSVEGGWGILRALVIIMTADQQRAAGSGQQPTLVHEPKHQ